MTKNDILDLHMEEIEPMDAPSEDSWWQGVLSGIAVVGMVAAIGAT
ncbi:MpaA1 family daptide-type RiPP [Arthrobacter sp. RAF14]